MAGLDRADQRLEVHGLDDQVHTELVRDRLDHGHVYAFVLLRGVVIPLERLPRHIGAHDELAPAQDAVQSPALLFLLKEHGAYHGSEQQPDNQGHHDHYYEHRLSALLLVRGRRLRLRFIARRICHDF
ncbi:hypothetical protein DSECCO2_225740 [anaerobic digester metagenome]